MGKYVITYRDYGTPGELSTVTFPGADLTDTNIVAETTAADVLRAAMEALIVGGIEQRTMVAWVNDTKIAPTVPFAQRETKWLVKYHQTGSGDKHTLEIPTADLNYLDPNANDKILMTDTDVLAFIAAFEAYVKIDGSLAVEVDEILFVSRKS
jgi:hypothetical protein